jgi:hypothetical protein
MKNIKKLEKFERNTKRSQEAIECANARRKSMSSEIDTLVATVPPIRVRVISN